MLKNYYFNQGELYSHGEIAREVVRDLYPAGKIEEEFANEIDVLSAQSLSR